MSKSSELRDAEICVTSRLWYTSSTILTTPEISHYLANYTRDDVSHLRQLIQAVLLAPYDNKHQQHEWISHKLLLLLDQRNSEKTKEKLVILQLLFTLKLINKEALDLVIKQELLDLIKVILTDQQDSICAINFSSTSVQWLMSSLLLQPFVTCWLINNLLHTQSTPCLPFDLTLQDLVSDALRLVAKSEKDNGDLATLFCILSQFNFTLSKQEELLTWLYPYLFQVCKPNQVELVFYSRSDIGLMREWHKFLDHENRRSMPIDNLENVRKINDIIFLSSTDDSSKSNLREKELMLRVIKRQVHWLLDILDMCCLLLKNREYEETSRILSRCPLLRSLWPVILIYFLHNLPNVEITDSDEDTWEKSNSICESLKFLLDKCCLIKYEFHEPILANLIASLNYQLSVIKWILDYRKNNNEKYSLWNVGKSCYLLSVKGMLSGLQDQCVLAVLKQSIDIHECEYNKIKSLLKDDSEALQMFSAYRAMQVTLKAILASEKYCVRDRRRRGAKDDDEPSAYYTELEHLINGIASLQLRMKVIENVFAMLFLRHDLHFSQVVECTSEEEEGYETTFSEKERHSSAQEGKEGHQQHKRSFVCNDYTVRQLLCHLRRCIVQVGMDFAKLRREATAAPSDLEAVEKSIFAIDKALSDAVWRFELLTGRDLAENNEAAVDLAASSSDSDDLLSVLDERLTFSFRLKNKSIFYRNQRIAADSSSEEHRSDLDGSSTPETSSTDANNATSQQKRVRKRNSVKNIVSATVTDEARATTNSKFIINFMLASKESLVLQCLWKADYAKAQQVIEMFNMKSTHLDGQVRFSKAMQNFRHEIMKQMSTSDTVDSSKKGKEFQILEKVRRAAQGGYASSRVASLLETWVAGQQPKAIGEPVALCALDLALTLAPDNRQASASLLEVAAKHVRAERGLEGTRHAAHLERARRLLEARPSSYCESLPRLLCDASLPLTTGSSGEADWAQQLGQGLDRFRRGRQPLDEFALASSLVSQANAYVHRLLGHLRVLRSIVPSSATESDLLAEPLDSYFARQIFELGVEPESLEPLANKLGVNLVHNVLLGCCPRLDSQPSLAQRPVVGRAWGCLVLNCSFDKPRQQQSVHSDPNQCVAEILSELLDAIKRLYPDCARVSHSELAELARDEDIQKILDKTSQLVCLDLSELSVGEHTLTFFLNLWNLLFLHALLTVWLTDPPQPLGSLRHSISLVSVNCQVGDLGRISLASLRSKLLGDTSWDPEFFSRSEDLNEVAWQDLDLVHDPRVMFAMANEFYQTPAIRVYHPHTLDRDLTLALRDYLECYKNVLESEDTEDPISGGKIQVLFPDFVKRYENYVKMVEPSRLGAINAQLHAQDAFFASSIYFGKSARVVCNYEQTAPFFGILFRYENTSGRAVDLSMTTKRTNPSQLGCFLLKPVKPSILHYLEGHCWLISYLVKRVLKEASPMTESGCDDPQRTACFENNLSSEWVATLSSALFEDNPALASIRENLSLIDLWFYLEKRLKDNQLQDCLDVVNALPVKLVSECTEIQCLKDKLLSQQIRTAQNESPDRIMCCLHQIKDINVLAQSVLSNLNGWPVHLCQDALFHALHHVDSDTLPPHCKFKMNETLCRATIFHKMLPYCLDKETDSTQEATWHDVVHCTEKTDPASIIQALVEADKFELCLEWLEYQTFSLEIQSLVTQDLLIGLLKNNESDSKNARKLLSALPVRQSMKMCKGILKRSESIRAMKFAIEFLLEHCEAEKTEVYHKTCIGVEILDQLEVKDRAHYLPLVKEPLLMLEQLLMNCRFENLRRILNVLQQRLDLQQKANISIESFDAIVRFYAGKSLEFRVSLQRDTDSGRSKDSTPGSQSTASGDQNETVDEDDEFVMPVNVPTREEWVPNDKARECSCCKAVIFSMFNRRHHCRRCGRVVCASCSQQRMQVFGYLKSVLVRVCDDCKKQTILQIQTGTPSAASSVALLDCWKLTTEETHNQTVRQEFSFEYAPNISLCLAIVSLHSDHKAYASFLLDRCDEMKRLLQPVTGGRVNPEVDHALIIKMIRSLLVAVKVKCAKLGLNAGLAHCDRFLSQVDLIATLVQSDCLALIPSDDSLGEHALRKLRDLLTEKELWTLALDVSTKSGLDTQGVWAAWGKACLKAGYLERARTKFSHCLEKVLYENFEDWVLVSYSDAADYASKSSEESLETHKQLKPSNNSIDQSPASNRKRQTTKNRPNKDPPLLLEILQILENQSQLNPAVEYAHSNSCNAAQEIMTTMNSLKAISQGQYTLVHSWNSRSVYYEESLYYLLAYASSGSILEFFVKHGELSKCLSFIVEANVEPELFFNAVYMRCLNVGKIEKLLSTMSSEDPTLLSWKKYLVYTCHSLDKRHLLHTLYHLQLFMRDFIRAAMTCIRFYKNEARDYVDLCAKSQFLFNAQGHLETELNSIDSLSNKKRRKSVTSSLSGGGGGLTMEMEPSEIDKHFNTISRQLEIAKFLSEAEREGRPVGSYLRLLLDMDTSSEDMPLDELPTLFGNQQQKTRLAVLAILCGRDTEEGFGIAFRIMQDYNLRAQKVYSLAGHVLAMERKIGQIEQLIKCCRSSGAPDTHTMSDRVLTYCVKLLVQNAAQAELDAELKDGINRLIGLINDVELKSNAYIESKQLKAAYLLAVKHHSAQDIRKILKEADKLGQNAIRSICIKWLEQTQNSL